MMNTEQLLEFRMNVQTFIRRFGLLEQTVTPCGFPLSLSQVYALQELEASSLSVTELAGRLGLERSSVSRLADGLVNKGFLDRAPNQSNRRETILSLTEKGQKSIQQVRDTSVSFYQGILSRLTEQDQQLVMAGFQKFTSAIVAAKENPNAQ